MYLERWSHILVLEADLPILQALLFSRRLYLPWLSDEQRAMVERLAGSGLLTVDNQQVRLSERGYRVAFAEPWYVGGGVAFFWHEQVPVVPNSR